MPKGVEHDLLLSIVAKEVEVIESLMPKGVEHAHDLVEAKINGWE